MTIDLEQARREIAEKGWCVVPNLLAAEELALVHAALDAAVTEMRARGVDTHSETLDPNANNIRVYNLPDFDPVFIELLRHPVARALVEATIGPNIVSNFTANIAMPGSGSMNIHSDQALVIPAPWNEPWTMNIIWCFDDVHEGNGATRYVPGSQHYRTLEDVPADIREKSVAFAAPAGSLIAMEGRVWHTSGANTSANERRAMAFAYYSKDFVRQQVNWDACLSPETQQSLDPDARAMLGMGPSANTRLGGSLTRLKAGEKPNVTPRAALASADR